MTSQLSATYIHRADKAISSTDDKRDSQTAHRFHSKYAFSQHCFMGIWSLSETDQSQEKWLRKLSATFAFHRDALQKPTNISVKLFFEIFSPNTTPTMPVTQDECSVAAITKAIGRTMSLVCLIIGKFLSPVAVAGKLGNSSGACISWLWSALYGEANTHSQSSPHGFCLYLLLYKLLFSCMSSSITQLNIFGSKPWFHHFPAVWT